MSIVSGSIDISNYNKNEKSQELRFRLVILGRSLVGKSAITFRFINDVFPKDHDTTIEDQYQRTVIIDGYKCNLEILDTAGQDDYQTMLETWVNFGSGFLLVYSIDDHYSFEDIQLKYNKIVLLKEKELYSCILVGNKCDLDDECRKVSKKEAEEYAKSKGISFLEVSALNKINIKESFLTLVHDLIEKKHGKDKKSVVEKMCGCNIF